MTGAEAIARIHSYSRQNAAPGLQRVQALLERMGHPERAMKLVHIVGTNGKGSTAAMLDAVLRAAGVRAGLYTSPYLSRFGERIRVDGAEIPDSGLAAVTGLACARAADMADPPTEFELVTCIALEHFRRSGCTLAVLEAGMGGRRDATNAIPPPEAVVLTNIGLDHTAVLGRTVEEIAAEKAAVIKPGCEVVLYPQSRPVEALVAGVCAQQGARLTVADSAALCVYQNDRDGQRFSYGPFSGLYLPLLGGHQQKNAAVALETVLALRRRGWNIPDEAVRRGLAGTRWPGRFELLCRAPWFVVDGGHNPQCAAAVARGLEFYFPGEQAVFLLGVMADKDCAGLTGQIAAKARAFVAVAPENSRALPAGALADFLARYGKPVSVCGSVRQGVSAALALAGTGGLACAMGSLYLTGAVRACFGR